MSELKFEEKPYLADLYKADPELEPGTEFRWRPRERKRGVPLRRVVHIRIETAPSENGFQDYVWWTIPDVEHEAMAPSFRLRRWYSEREVEGE